MEIRCPNNDCRALLNREFEGTRLTTFCDKCKWEIKIVSKKIER